MSPEPAPVQPASGKQPRKQAARTPNFKTFIITGAIIGLFVGALLGMREPGGPSYSAVAPYDSGSAMGYLGAFGAMLGAGLAAIVALLLERSGRQ